jgi:ComEC/Rec2-related protein
LICLKVTLLIYCVKYYRLSRDDKFWCVLVSDTLNQPRYMPWIVMLAPAVALAAVLLAQLASVPDRAWMGLWVAIAVVASLALKQRRRVGWLLLGLAIGFSLMHLRMLTWQEQALPSVWSDVSFNATIEVDGLARASPAGGWQVPTKLIATPSPRLDAQTVLLHFPTVQAPLPGEQWQARLHLYAVTGQHNPGGIDFEAWLFSQHIMATGSVLALSDDTKTRHWHWQYWRWLALSKLLSVLPAESAFSGLNIALVLGEGAGISASQWQVLRDTGTLHLAVVSGMHITLIAGLAWALAVGLWKLFPSQRLPAYLVGSVAALVAALAFAVLAGLTVPVQRALIMLLVVLMAIWLKRSLHPMLTLSWALLVVLLWDVSSVLQVGFWLSFIATGILIWILSLPGGRVVRLLAVHLGMSLLMAPFLILFFNQIPTYSPLANLIASPVVEVLLVPILLVTAILAWFAPSVAMQLASLADTIWALLWQVLSTMATWSYSVWLLSPLALFSGLSADEQRLTLLDMGRQPMVAVWQGQQGNWLIGTGSQIGKQHTMDSIILPSLTTLGVHQLAGVVLTGDDDGAQSGLTLLQKRIPVTTILHGSMCDGKTDAWQWQQNGDNCWLRFNPQLALTWQQPSQGLDALTSIVAPAPNSKNSDTIKPLFWLSPSATAHDSWAKTVKGTRCSGAITLDMTGKEMTLLREYRLADKRFYHGDCQ